MQLGYYKTLLKSRYGIYARGPVDAHDDFGSRSTGKGNPSVMLSCYIRPYLDLHPELLLLQSRQLLAMFALRNCKQTKCSFSTREVAADHRSKLTIA